MIDIHNHILPNIDDGSKSFEESINILKQAYESGVTDIIVTPHFILGSSYSSKVKDNETILKELKNKLKLENININLYLGNEIYKKTCPIEVERLQTLPDNYTEYGIKNGELVKIPKTKRFEAVGNGWCVDVIVHILQYLN